MKSVLIILTCLSLSSCAWMARKAYGIKKPKPETETSVNAYAHNMHLKTDNIIYLKDTASYRTIIKQKWLIAVPDIFIFNKKGEYMNYRDDKSCNAKAFGITPRLCSINTPPVTNNYLNIIFDNFVMQQHKPLQNNLSAFDYTVFITFTKFSGKLNKDHVKVWEDSLLQNHGCNIQIIKLNLDIPKP